MVSLDQNACAAAAAAAEAAEAVRFFETRLGAAEAAAWAADEAAESHRRARSLADTDAAL